MTSPLEVACPVAHPVAHPHASKDGKRMKAAVRQAGTAVEGAASEATAKAANVFLAQGGEKQADSVPPEAAAATAARSGAAGDDAGSGAGAGVKED